MFKYSSYTRSFIPLAFFAIYALSPLMASEMVPVDEEPKTAHLTRTHSFVAHSYETDILDLLTKTQFKGRIILQNRLNRKATVEIIPEEQVAKGCGHPSILVTIGGIFDKLEDLFHPHHHNNNNNELDVRMEGIGHTQKVKIAGNSSRTITNFSPDLSRLKLVQKFGRDHYFLNLAGYNKDVVILDITEIQLPVFPIPLKPFDFMPKLFQSLNDLVWWANCEKMKPYGPQYPPCDNMSYEQFQKEFDGNLITLALIVCPGEGIKNSDEMFQKRGRLYELNQFNPYLTLPAPAAGTKPKIPSLNHRIWLTNPEAPCELPDKYIEWASRSAALMPAAEGWGNILWIMHRSILPETYRKVLVEKIQIREVFTDSTCTQLKDLTDFDCRETFENALKARKFGMSSDILRLAIIEQMGGTYDDTDYLDGQSPYLINLWYDFYCGIEPMSNFIGNAKFAACPHHPVIKKALKLIKKNSDPLTMPKYISDVPADDGFRTILITGPANLTIAFHLAAGKATYRDIAFPPAFLYPSKIPGHYPQKEVVQDGDPLPPEALGAHYWETSWAKIATRAKFGSNG